MSEDNSDVPQDPPPHRKEPQPIRGLMALGILVGAVALYALYFGTTAGIAPDQGYRTFLAGPAVFIPIAVYLAVAGILTVRPRTSQLGAGLLIGLGVFTLLGGGVCVMALSQMRA
ncbi:hypothetical protein ACIQCN_10040 [Pseudarthrobacter sp. NPDC092424]|uniref:hypothetical protein n=1 Tax=Pseudarthrobacter sp. NPDC092424 TaxID=3364415 RepID=UPI0037FD5F3D